MASSLVCESQFLISYNNQNLRKFNEFSKNKVVQFNERIEASTELDVQLDLIEKQFKKLTYNFNASIKKHLESVKKYSSNEAVYNSFLDKKVLATLSHYQYYSDLITDTLSNVMKVNKVPHVIKKKKMSSDSPTYKYIELDLTQVSDYRSLKVLKKYKERFKIDHITVDFLSAIRQGFAGFRSGNQIDIGIMGLKHIMVDDILSLVTKHEPKHANFSVMRENGISSPFHIQFQSGGSHPISEISTGYSQYMSAEELYNYTNNSFWSSRRLQNIDNYKVDQILADVNLIHSQVFEAIKIAEQTEDMTKSFLAYLEILKKKKIPNNKSTLIFMDNSNNQAFGVDNAIFIGIVDEKRDILMKVFVEESMKAEVKAYLQIQKDLMLEFNSKIQKIGSPKDTDEANKFIQDFLIQEARETKSIQMSLISRATSQVEKLNTFSIAVQVNAPKVIEKQIVFIKKLKQSLSHNTNFIKKEKWQKEFTKQINLVREFGTTVRRAN
jgi:hypothetical protein